MVVDGPPFASIGLMQMGTARALLAAGLFCVSACGGGGDDTGGSWSSVIDGQPAALLSVWGASSSDVWVVGGHGDTGTAPIVMHYDGTGWDQLDPGVTSVDLWWVFGFEGGPVFMGGSSGTILRYQDGAFETMTTPASNVIIFGIWGARPDDVWAVGGVLGAGARGFAWHYDGSAWSASDQVPVDIAESGTLFKVSGRASDDVWMVGYNNLTGLSLQWDGQNLNRSDIDVEAPMLSVACQPQRCIAAGGGFDGAMFENDGGAWTSVWPSGGPVLNGAAATDSAAYVVGHAATVLARGDSGWSIENIGGATTLNLHADWIDPDGGVWAVGGNFDSTPTTDGVLIHKGQEIAGDIR